MKKINETVLRQVIGGEKYKCCVCKYSKNSFGLMTIHWVATGHWFQ